MNDFLCYIDCMKKEIFPYEVEMGTIMDYVDGRFMLVIKDEYWTDEELRLLDRKSVV